jgi:hypothetical protein
MFRSCYERMRRIFRTICGFRITSVLCVTKISFSVFNGFVGVI